jgi:hypothetical protein
LSVSFAAGVSPSIKGGVFQNDLLPKVGRLFGWFVPRGFPPTNHPLFRGWASSFARKQRNQVAGPAKNVVSKYWQNVAVDRMLEGLLLTPFIFLLEAKAMTLRQFVLFSRPLADVASIASAGTLAIRSAVGQNSRATNAAARSRCGIAAWVVCCVFGIAGAASAAGVRTVAISGQPIPGTRDEATYANFSLPALNAFGQVAFSASLIGRDVNSTNGQGVWSERNGLLTLVARTGEPAPGAPIGAMFSNLPIGRSLRGSPLLNSAGQTAFWAAITGVGVDASNDTGIWSDGSGSLASIVREGDQAVGTLDGAKFGDFGQPGSNRQLGLELRLNSAGKTAFSAFLTGGNVNGTNDKGLWSSESGSLRLVARTGDPAPGMPTGVNFADMVFAGNPQLNAAGQTAFSADLTGIGVNGANGGSVWLEESGTFNSIVQTGHSAPGTGRRFVDFSTPVLNSAGQLAFTGEAGNSSVVGSITRGIWAADLNTVRLVARSGDSAPGTSVFFNFSSFAFPLTIDATGDVAFWTPLSGSGVNNSNNLGIWSEGFSGLHLVARKGNQAAGTPSGVNHVALSAPTANSMGQVAFSGTLAGGGVDSTNDSGIWAEDRTGIVRLIAREGELLEVAPGEFRTIASIDFHNGGLPIAFNDFGQLAFWAQFTDGSSGIFVSNLATVPEPSGVIFCLMTLIVGWRRRRR